MKRIKLCLPIELYRHGRSRRRPCISNTLRSLLHLHFCNHFSCVPASYSFILVPLFTLLCLLLYRYFDPVQKRSQLPVWDHPQPIGAFKPRPSSRSGIISLSRHFEGRQPSNSCRSSPEDLPPSHFHHFDHCAQLIWPFLSSVDGMGPR